MIAFIESLYPSAVKDGLGNLYITKGKSPTYPCIVAHMDTVHSLTRGDIEPIEYNGNIAGFDPYTMTQTGIGGDDKCGIWAALVMLHNLKACKVALFVDEEVGCKGSRAADLEFFKDCRFILQADRRNDSWNSKAGINYDFITSIGGDDISSKDFRKAVKPYLEKWGYTTCSGMMTDVQELIHRDVGVSCANMSAGYFRPHSDKEYINIRCLEKAVGLIYDICINLKEAFPYKVKKREWKNSTYNHHLDDWEKKPDGSWVRKPGSPKSETYVNGKKMEDRKYETWWEKNARETKEGKMEEIKEDKPLPSWWKGKIDNPRLTGPVQDNVQLVSVNGVEAYAMTDDEFSTYNVM